MRGITERQWGPIRAPSHVRFVAARRAYSSRREGNANRAREIVNVVAVEADAQK